MRGRMSKWYNFDFDSIASWENPPREGTDQSDQAHEFMRDLNRTISKYAREAGFKVIEKPNKKSYYDFWYILKDKDTNTYIQVIVGDIRWKICGRDWSEGIIVREYFPKSGRGYGKSGHNNWTTINEFEKVARRIVDFSVSKK